MSASWFNDDDVPKNLTRHAKRVFNFFEPRRASVVSVRCFYNFGPIQGGYRGLSVQLKPTYVLSEEDRLWLHGDYYRSTTVALCHVSDETMRVNLKKVRSKVWLTTGLTNDDEFGVYMERRPREYSAEIDCVYHAILTRTPTKREIAFTGTVENWVARVRAAYTSMDPREDNLRQIRDIFPKAECVKHATTNIFLRDNSTWRFINCAWNVKPTEESVYLLTHPSVGYSIFNVEAGDRSKTIPIDMGVSEQVTSLESMKPARRQHIKNTHRWDSEQSVHIRVQTEARDWRREAPLRSMGLYDPTTLHVVALKLGYPDEPMTLERGCALTNEAVYYDFSTVATALSERAMSMFRPEFVHGNRFKLTKEDCARFGIVSEAGTPAPQLATSPPPAPPAPPLSSGDASDP